MLVGFLLNLLGPHLLHRSVLHGTTFVYWLDRTYRAGWFPYELLKFNRNYLREQGCKRIFVAVDPGYKDGRVAKLFTRLGYHPLETHYSQVF